MFSHGLMPPLTASGALQDAVPGRRTENGRNVIQHAAIRSAVVVHFVSENNGQTVRSST